MPGRAELWLHGRLDHGVQPPTHRGTGGAKSLAQPDEVAPAAQVLLLDQPCGHQHGGG